MTNWGRGWVTIDKSVLQAADDAQHTKARHRGGSTTGKAPPDPMTRQKTVTITTAAHESLKKSVIAYKNLQKEKAEMEKAMKTLVDENAALTQNVNGQAAQITTLTTQLNEQNTDNSDRDQHIEDLQKELAECQEALAKTGGVDESKLNTELLMHTESTAKSALFRTWKFIENDEDQVNAATDIIPYLPVALEIPEPEYITNYKGKVNEGLGKARQYVQSEGKKRAQGTQ